MMVITEEARVSKCQANQKKGQAIELRERCFNNEDASFCDDAVDKPGDRCSIYIYVYFPLNVIATTITTTTTSTDNGGGDAISIAM